jgi:2-amino-4-hydroxy-6-hydroxymethyldihydropteridine diphosphokinase
MGNEDLGNFPWRNYCDDAAFDDKIHIHGLRCDVYCGIDEGEQDFLQEITVNVTVAKSFSGADQRRDIRHSIDYTAVAAHVQRTLNHQHFNLIEGISHRLCEEILRHFRAAKTVTVSAHKCPLPWMDRCNGFSAECMLRRSIVAIALGSNLGDRHGHLLQALESIEGIEGTKTIATSSVQETAPVLLANQGMFLNQCAVVESFLSPLNLLLHLQRIENELGRIRTIPNGPRTMDIDILLFDGICLRNPLLQIPHPHLGKRQFWIDGLAECGIKVWPEPFLLH